MSSSSPPIKLIGTTNASSTSPQKPLEIDVSSFLTQPLDQPMTPQLMWERSMAKHARDEREKQRRWQDNTYRIENALAIAADKQVFAIVFAVSDWTDEEVKYQEGVFKARTFFCKTTHGVSQSLSTMCIARKAEDVLPDITAAAPSASE